MNNPFKILGVHLRSTEAEIRGAYIQLAKKHHPDKKKGDIDKFQPIAEAYQLIKDKKAQNAFFKAHYNSPLCQACSGKGATYKSNSLFEKTYTACKTCGGAAIIIKEKSDVTIELSGTTGPSRKGRNKAR